MRKRFLSLLCVLALCLGLLPATALAAGPNTVYVGGEALAGSSYSIVYATTNESGEVITEGATTDNYNIKWDGSTLTLRGATIKKELNDYGESLFYITGAAIGVINQSGDAGLTITLEGTNTIKDVSYGICVRAPSNGSAKLTITGSGSLDVSATSTGIRIQSDSGDAAVSINNAKVTATAQWASGVNVRCGTNSSASLTVNGGNLTPSGSQGILYDTLESSIPSTIKFIVSNSAIVDARGGGIGAGYIGNLSGVSPTDDSVGIVFGHDRSDSKAGTVYGAVTLQEDLEIGEGESLNIPDGSSLNISDGKTLTVNGGELTGENIPTEGVVYKVTEVKLDKDSLSLEVGGTATLTATITPNNATDKSVTWESSAPSVADVAVNADGSATVTAVSAGTATITVTTADGSGEKATCSVTVHAAAVSVTGVSLNKNTLELYTGKRETLIATVEPSDATNPAVNWSSDKPEVATVEGGTVTAKAAGTATITATAADSSGVSATCTVTVTQSTYSISADTTALDFGSVYTGYTQPAAQTVTITNTGNQPLTLTQPAPTTSFEVGTLTDTELTAGEKATFTVQPKAGLAVGAYNENITISGTNDVNATISATFTVKQYSSGGGTPTKTPSQQAVDKIESAKDGSTVEIKLSTGNTKLDKEVFEELAGRDVTLEISLSNGVTWTVNGQDIPENADLTDLDMGVSLNTSTIPVSVINTVTGAVDTIQLSLKHDGEFGFAMTLSAPLGKTNAGYWANLYYYNTRTRALEFQTADKIASDGTASFPFSHASDYAIVIDTDSHEPVELPFTDVPEGAWYEDAAAYVYKHGLMAGTSATTFAPDVTTSRAMIATILWRMAGSPVVNYAMNYTDVAQGQWCSEAIRWATSEGVVTGYGNGLFGTNDPITREQLATMLWRYAQTEGYDVSIGEDTNILSYTDVADLSEYAIPAMQWACGAGVINGTGDGSTLTPQGQATRAQAAVMLMRFCEEYVVW